jgi:hypothetical protein
MASVFIYSLLLLLISMAWPRDSRSEDTPLSESTRTELCFPGSDAQRLLQIGEEAPLKDQEIAPWDNGNPSNFKFKISD